MGNCNTCPSKEGCSKPQDQCGIVMNPNNQIKHVIGVMSGKGGVGKSSVSVMLAQQLASEGYQVGILDADITGPSIPRLTGVADVRAGGTDGEIYPVTNDEGIKVISINLLLEDEGQPVVWRGPVVGNVVKQFWEEVVWGELDYLVVDMPPGTGDVALTALQIMPISGVVMVSTPQDMVSMIVTKAVHMVRKMGVEVFGIVENMSYIQCPDCDKQIKMFSGAGIERFLEENDLRLLGELPMIQEVCQLSEKGYSESKETIQKLFAPIVRNILDK
ncbi:MAG: Mrp/NBP35 family ATP-binding protein [Cellulosilyticaceae bacterium]